MRRLILCHKINLVASLRVDLTENLKQYAKKICEQVW